RTWPRSWPAPARGQPPARIRPGRRGPPPAIDPRRPRPSPLPARMAPNMAVIPRQSLGPAVPQVRRDAELIPKNWLRIWPASAYSPCTRTVECNTVTEPILLVAASSPASGRLTYRFPRIPGAVVLHHEARAMAGDR